MPLDDKNMVDTKRPGCSLDVKSVGISFLANATIGFRVAQNHTTAGSLRWSLQNTSRSLLRAEFLSRLNVSIKIGLKAGCNSLDCLLLALGLVGLVFLAEGNIKIDRMVLAEGRNLKDETF